MIDKWTDGYALDGGGAKPKMLVRVLPLHVHLQDSSFVGTRKRARPTDPMRKYISVACTDSDVAAPILPVKVWTKTVKRDEEDDASSITLFLTTRDPSNLE